MRKENTKHILNKTLLFGSVLFFNVHVVLGQFAEQNLKSSWEVAGYGGISNFKGDIAPNINFRNIKQSFGASLKYNLDYYSGVRVIFNSISIAAKDRRFNNPFNQFRNENFKANILEFGALYDYNFIPFSHPKQLLNWSPYLVAGLSILAIRAENEGVQNFEVSPVVLSIPFGGGTRIQINPQWIVNFEVIARKTFTDLLDLPEQTYPDGKQKSISTNNDWVYTFQVGLSYTFVRVVCPDPVRGIKQ